MPAGFMKGVAGANSQPKSHMLKAVSILFAVSVCGLLVRAYTPTTSSGLAQELLLGSTASKTMDPFTKVVICAPLNVKIVPSAEYKVAVVADEAVENAISTRVHQGTLSIEITRSFWTDKAVQLTVGLPHDQLQLVHIKAPATTVAVAAGFNVHHFTGINGGSAALYLKGLNAEEASLQNTG